MRPRFEGNKNICKHRRLLCIVLKSGGKEGLGRLKMKHGGGFGLRASQEKARTRKSLGRAKMNYGKGFGYFMVAQECGGASQQFFVVEFVLARTIYHMRWDFPGGTARC